MKRYFYDDMLAILWMKKYYGMKFVDSNEEELLFNRWCILSDFKTGIYIAPDSLHLLEPQIGDHMKAKYKGDTIHAYFCVFNGGNAPETNDMNSWQTLERSGKAFMWPESEEA